MSQLSLNRIQTLNNNQNHNISQTIKNNTISGDKLEELFKTATDLIQNLPKNGNY
jgi:hypothetical protein